MNLERKYILVSNRGPDLTLGGKQHLAKGGTKSAYKSLFKNYCFKRFFLLPKDFSSNKSLGKLTPIFIDNKLYDSYYYKYVSEYLYLCLLGIKNKFINYLDYEKDFELVSNEIIKHINKYQNIILCDYHLYLLPQKLSGKHIIYYWFIPILSINNYKDKDTIKEVVYSLNFCDKIVFLNKTYLENFKKLFSHFFPNKSIKSELLVNTLGADKFFINKENNIKKNKPIKIGMISRLDPVKNILNTIKGYLLFLKTNDYNVKFEILSNFHRQDSEFYKKYENKIIKSINNFEFKDKIDIKFGDFGEEYVKNFYKEVDIFVCLSFYDGMPLTVLEFILSNKNNYNKKLLLSKNIGSYQLLKDIPGIVGINPFSIEEIKKGFEKVFTNNEYINMEKSFKISESNSLQNREVNNKNFLNQNKIILLGSGDTLGTPVVGCNCEVCKTEKRTRFGVYLSYKGKNILIDTNPDLKRQFLENNLDYKDIDYIFITHTHTDHINGLGELSFRKKIKLFHPNDEINMRNMNYFNYLEREEVIEKISFKNFEFIELEEDIRILPLPLNHGFPTSGLIIYLGNIKIGIISDTNLNLDEKVLEIYKNCDYIFIDGFSENLEQILGLYKQIGEEKTLKDLEEIRFHTTIKELDEMRNSLNCKNMVVVHISHIAGKYDYLQKKYKDLIIGKDNLEFLL